jgi:hypothetical protein
MQAPLKRDVGDVREYITPAQRKLMDDALPSGMDCDEYWGSLNRRANGGTGEISPAQRGFSDKVKNFWDSIFDHDHRPGFVPKFLEQHDLGIKKLQPDRGVQYIHSLWSRIPSGTLIPFLWTVFALFILAGAYFIYKIIKELIKICSRHKGHGHKLPDVERHSREKHTQGPPATQGRYANTTPQHRGDRQTEGPDHRHPAVRVQRNNQPDRQGVGIEINRPGHHKASKQPAPQPQPRQSNIRVTKLAIPVFKPI